MSNNASINIEELADIFKALSNPNRLKIVRKLMCCCKPGTVLNIDACDSASCIGELGADLGVGKSTTSHHIKELKRVGLIKTQRHGQKIKCWIDPELINSISIFFKARPTDENSSQYVSTSKVQILPR
ncbi:MAG: winged helix-turn-helix transcriptional regulator [Bacteroidetes bacterium]|nr:winged helix-turn-helix transcriptional regulator [Bacteroidota bacterium]